MLTNTQLIIQSWCPRLIIILWVILDTYEKRRLYITVKLCTILAKTKVTNSKTNPQNVKEFNFYVVDLIHYTDLSSRCFQVINTTPCAYPRKDIDYFRFPSEIPWNKFQANWTERSATIVITHTYTLTALCTVLIVLNRLSTVNILWYWVNVPHKDELNTYISMDQEHEGRCDYHATECELNQIINSHHWIVIKSQ